MKTGIFIFCFSVLGMFSAGELSAQSRQNMAGTQLQPVQQDQEDQKKKLREPRALNLIEADIKAIKDKMEANKNNKEFPVATYQEKLEKFEDELKIAKHKPSSK